MRKQTWLLMHNLKMPDEFMNLKGLHSMMFILYSRISNQRDLKNSEFSELCTYYDEIILPCSTIYKENNILKRQIFFKTPIIKWLWYFIFIKTDPKALLTHLRRVRSFPYEGEERFRTLILDMRYCEIQCDIILLPEIA
jgi:hypothetical protein